jgi:hypothetical protein
MPHATEPEQRIRIDAPEHRSSPTEQALGSHLHGLAQWVAARLDENDDTSAWTVTTALERAAGIARADVLLPSGPAIGRRFAQAHRRLLELAQAGDRAALEAGLTVSVDPAARQITTTTAAA